MKERRDPFADTPAARPVNGSMSKESAGVNPGTKCNSLSTVVRPSAPMTTGKASICSRTSPYSSAISSKLEFGLTKAGRNGRNASGGIVTGMPGSTSKGALRQAE